MYTWNIHHSDHILSYKTHIDIFKKIKILSDYGKIKMEVNNKELSRKPQNIWGKSTFLNKNWVKKKSKDQNIL